MTEYTVTYSIQVAAADAHAAATIVADLLEDGGAQRGYYEVTEHGKPGAPTVAVDLTDDGASPA